MKTLYFDCSMGAAGDMLAAALLELFPNREETVAKLNALGIPGVRFLAEPSVKCGICGTHLRVLIGDTEEEPDTHSHHGSGGLADIEQLLYRVHIPYEVHSQVMAVYRCIAEAESAVHGVPVTQIHFHEVGALDAVADITAVCYLMAQLKPQQVLVSPIHVGSGQVKCAHGILPVPAPATAHILKGIPIYGGEIRGELCTPTGAALLKHFVTRFAPLPSMVTEAVGYGMGKKDFPAANCVRAMLGETQDSQNRILELKCNLDDMTGEAIGFATEQLLAAGALDVFTTPIGMKKNRPGILLTVLCREADREAMVQQLFRHTTTLGIRENTCNRYTLERTTQAVSTPYGPVHKKTATGYGVSRSKWEYEDLARIAREHDLALDWLPKE